MPTTIFVNLPVSDLSASTRFYEAIGCRKDLHFSDERTSAMSWSDTITFHLLTLEHFADFAPRPVADPRKTCQMLLYLTSNSRQHVDAVSECAALAGGKVDVRRPIDIGFFYNRTFEDLDGHIIELAWMSPDAESMRTDIYTG